MTAIARDAMLAIAVLACWLGAAAYIRLRGPLDRLHCVTFVNVVSGAAILIAAAVSDGASNRVAKILVLIAIALWDGAALAHATGRALLMREGER